MSLFDKKKMENYLEKQTFTSFCNQNIVLNVLKADISLIANIDCIVNCTGNVFQHRSGVSRSIALNAGPNLIKEFDNYLENNEQLEENDVVVTSAYDLANFKHILHVHTSNDPTKLEKIYDKLFHVCFNQLNLNSIAVPLIGTGAFLLQLNKGVEPIINSIKKLVVTKRVTIAIVNNNTNQYATCVKIIENLIEQKDEQICPICLSNISEALVLDICGHTFCRKCIEQSLKYKNECPYCKQSYGKQIGNQPPGTMNVLHLDQSLPGFDPNIKTIQIIYNFPSGIQKAEHPNPGIGYQGTVRVAYLPDNTQGKHILNLLKKAFEQRLIFTIGQSRTTGKSNVITWNDIHHKTSVFGGPTNFGYPDPNYLNRVEYELASKGVK